MQAPRRALSFYTYGDVTMEKFYRAISYLIDEPHILVLSMPIIAPDTAVFLQQCFERGWVSNLVLSTSRDATKLIDIHLKDYQSHVLYTNAKDVSNLSSHIVLYNRNKALSITGPMLDIYYERSLTSYTMLLQESFSLNSQSLECGDPLFNILYPDIVRHRGAWIKLAKSGAERKISSALKSFLDL